MSFLMESGSDINNNYSLFPDYDFKERNFIFNLFFLDIVLCLQINQHFILGLRFVILELNDFKMFEIWHNDY